VKAFKNGAIQRTKTEQKMLHDGAFLKAVQSDKTILKTNEGLHFLFIKVLGYSQKSCQVLLFSGMVIA